MSDTPVNEDVPKVEEHELVVFDEDEHGQNDESTPLTGEHSD